MMRGIRVRLAPGFGDGVANVQKAKCSDEVDLRGS
jgi:hypothetical protein